MDESEIDAVAANTAKYIAAGGSVVGHVTIALRGAVAAEREACAKICDETWVAPGDLVAEACHEAAAAIRARGQREG